MSYLSQIPENTLTVDIAAIPILFQPKVGCIVARAEFGMVVLFVDNRRVELTTIVAHNVGLVIARAIPNLEPSEMIVISINGEKIELLKSVASAASTALLRKADIADDWQLNNLNRRYNA